MCVFWGTTYLGIRIALESFPPAVLVSIRYLISGSILLAFAHFRGAHLPKGRELWTTVISGVLIIAVGNGALSYAEQWMPSGLASLIITMSPFWFVIFEALLPGGVPLHAPTILGMAVGFSGTALLLLRGSAMQGLDRGFLGGFAVLQIGMIAWCLGSIYQRRQPVRAHPVVTGAVQQMASAVIALPVGFLIPHAPIVLKSRAVWAVAYLVVFGSIVGYSAYAFSIARLPVAIASIYPYFNCVVAVILGWLFYREPFGRRELAAMLIIFAGVAIVKWQSAKVDQRAGAAA